MCGIAGLIDARARRTEKELLGAAEAMAAAINHRGPDDSGAWCDAARGIALGHRRLAVIDLSAHGHQPMVSASGRYVLVYNGEIYNFSELRAGLESSGFAFVGHSDTEVLLALIARDGVRRALEQTLGMFAFAMWDREEATLTLARDRMGEKPLYYGRSGGMFLFASECRALEACPWFSGRVDRRALTEFLRRNYVPSPLSIYEGISKVPPGTFVTIDPREPDLATPTAYWSLSDFAGATRVNSSREEAATALRPLLQRAVRRQMVADVPLGAFLSGGIDSSVVVALMQEQSPQPIRTFTIGFHEAGFDEAPYAKAVAKHLGTDHTELYVDSDDALGVVPLLAGIYDEPFADPSQIPTHLVAALARRHVTVSLSGDGGDELFGGYTRYVFHQRWWKRLARVPLGLRRVGGGALERVPTHWWDRGVRVARPRTPAGWGGRVHKGARLLRSSSPESLYRSLTSYWENPSALISGISTSDAGDFEPAIPPVLSATERLMYTDALTYLPDDILVKVDRAAMAVSLETRVPLLDPTIVEFAWSLPIGSRVHDGVGKPLLRQLLRQYVPSSLVDRPKMGFGVPLGEWLRGALRPWAEELLSESRLRTEGYLEPSIVRQCWDEHVAGRRDWQYQLWGMLMFQAWLEAKKSGATTHV